MRKCVFRSTSGPRPSRDAPSGPSSVATVRPPNPPPRMTMCSMDALWRTISHPSTWRCDSTAALRVRTGQVLWRLCDSRRVPLRPDPDLETEFPGLEALVFEVRGLRAEPANDALALFLVA